MKKVLRVIEDNAHSGAMNMAIDEAILSSVSMKGNFPTLRFYFWNPACLSLGFNQSSKDINFMELKNTGTDIVRRPTGGRAVLHSEELTYSLCMPANGTNLLSVNESCRTIHTMIANALQQTGIQAEFAGRSSQSYNKNPVCFDTPSYSELIYNGKKIIGSAQVRKNGTLLQHGSLPLGEYNENINRFFNTPCASALKNYSFPLKKENMASLIAEIISAVAQQMELKPLTLTLNAEEKKEADRLFNDKYSIDSWTFRK